jgi:hypothetical protein
MTKEEILPIMDKNLYIQRLKASIELNKAIRREQIMQLKKMPRQERVKLKVIMEMMQSD